jgi:hypothetical protein
VSKGPYDEPSGIHLQKIVAAILLAILVIGGVAFYVNRSSQKVEHLAQLDRQIQPWCSQHHFGEPHVASSHSSLVALAQSAPPKWEVSTDSAVASCSSGPTSTVALFVLTFSSSDNENQWLEKDNATPYEIIGDNFPLPVWVGLGWVAVLGCKGNQESRAITSLSKVLKVDYRFSQFSTVSW